MKLPTKTEILSKARHAEKDRKRGIYFLIKDGEIVYVGKTVHLYNRLATHKSGKDFTSYYFLPIAEGKADMDEVERHYICKLKPKLNRRVPSLNVSLPVNESMSKVERAMERVKAGMTPYASARLEGMAMSTLYRSRLYREWKHSQK